MTIRPNVSPQNRELGIFALLRAEHYAIIHLLEQVSSTPMESQRQILFAQLHLSLLPHLKAEEETLYPRLQHRDTTRDVALEGEQEHRIITLLLGELQSMVTHGDIWMAKFKVFQSNVYHHLDQEEGTMIAEAAAVLSLDETRDIARTYRMSRDRHLRKLRAALRKPSTKEPT